MFAEHLKTLDEDARKPLKKLERFHAHLRRHTYASEWRDTGGSLAELQAILGRSSVTVTERYGRLADDLVLREVKGLVEYRKAVSL